jgi:endoglucanase
MVLAAFAFSCRPLPTSKEIEETPEGHPCPGEAIIDDGEDSNNQVLLQDNRSGYIYTFADDEGTVVEPVPGSQGGVFTMAPGGVNGSGYAARMKGKVAVGEVVFAGMGFNLTDPKDPYDASRYGGISFWAKRGPGSTGNVVFKIPDANTDPDGQVCSACYNDFSLPLRLTEEWQKYTVVFDALRQEPGWGAPRPSSVAADRLYAVQFQVKEKGADYDIWIDDVRFTGCD